MRNWLRSIVPVKVLELFRMFKRNQKRKKLNAEKNAGAVIVKEQLRTDIEACGIKQGDSVLVHASLSSIGYVENGASDLIEVFQEIIGTNGTLMMPTSPNDGLQFDYMKDLDFFDVQQAESKLGKLSETFRKLAGVLRSCHPTEPVSAWGKHALFVTKDHEKDETPYAVNSPFFKLTQLKGKILYIGVTLENAGTSLHVLEDIISDFPFQVYLEELFTYQTSVELGVKRRTKVHNPEWSRKRQCDGLIPHFIALGAAQWGSIGRSKVLVVDAFLMLKAMLFMYERNQITMYTPHSELDFNLKEVKEEFAVYTHSSLQPVNLE